MRAHDPYVCERERLARHEEVFDGNRRLPDDRERVLPEQIVCLGDRPCERALDRQHAESGLAVQHRPHDVDERPQCDELAAGKELLGACGAVRGGASCVGDARFCLGGCMQRKSLLVEGVEPAACGDAPARS